MANAMSKELAGRIRFYKQGTPTEFREEEEGAAKERKDRKEGSNGWHCGNGK